MGVWIETYLILCISRFSKSHPAWVCGLKPGWWTLGGRYVLSHPAWVCGLKPEVKWEDEEPTEVTPCVGVWIETQFNWIMTQQIIQSHPAWVCGLKPGYRCIKG